MSISTRITLAEYERMIAAGAFDGGLIRPRIELIDGELREMSPINEPHAGAVFHCSPSGASKTGPSEGFGLRVQCPIAIPDRESVPEPDIAWVARKDYRAHPIPADILLLIEVADSSLASDCGEKASLYASAGVADYWVVNIIDRCVEVFRQPQDGHYVAHEVFRAPEEVHPLAFPDVALPVAMLFP